MPLAAFCSERSEFGKRRTEIARMAYCYESAWSDSVNRQDSGDQAVCSRQRNVKVTGPSLVSDTCMSAPKRPNWLPG